MREIGETAFVRVRGQPFAEIVRVGCAKPRRNCVCAVACANPLRRSCVSDARNLDETALRAVRGQPFAEIGRVECVKCTLCHWDIGMH